MRLPHNRSGAMLLITVMIMGAVALLIGMSLALRGIGEMEMSFGSSQALKTQALADGCMEEVLLRLWGDSTYRGGEVHMADGQCDVTVVSEAEHMRISVEASIGKWQRSLSALVGTEDIAMQILEWRQER